MKRALTLIELLVVVAIVAILAAIALPNFLQAQTRAKVSRAAADLRTLRVALEAYAVDEGTYPLNAGGLGLTGALENLLQPRAYLSALPRDPFLRNAGYAYLAPGRLSALADNPFGAWVLYSVGPDMRPQTTLSDSLRYDPTNGTVSTGDVSTSHRPSG